MKFFIKRHSTLPFLDIPVEDISKKYDIDYNMWENCAVTFSMYDIDNNIFRVANKPAKLIAKERVINVGDPYNYFLRYEFTKKDTKNFGEYIGEFKVDFLDNPSFGKLTVPIDSQIEIIIKDSYTRTDFSDEINLG